MVRARIRIDLYAKSINFIEALFAPSYNNSVNFTLSSGGLFMKICSFNAIPSQSWKRAGIWGAFITLMFIWGVLGHINLLAWPSSDVLIGNLDSDIYIRLTKVKELIQGGSIYDHAVRATNAPYGGIETPWTQPLNFILYALYQLIPGDMAIEKKLLFVANWYPIIISVLIVFFSLKASETNVRRLSKLQTLIVLVIGYYLITPAYEYFLRGNADHQSLQALLWTIGVWCFLSEKTVKYAIVLGAALGLWVWVSPEALLFVYAFFLIIGYDMIQERRNSFFLMLTSLTLFAVTVLGLVFEKPLESFFTSHDLDTISIVYVFLFFLTFIGFAVYHYALQKLDDFKPRIISSLAVAGLLAVIFIATFPKFLNGPMADVDPYIFTNFLTRIWEAQPLLNTGFQISLVLLYLPVIAILLGVRFIKREMPLFILVLVTFNIALMQLKWSYYLEIVSIVTIARLLPVYFQAIAKKHQLNRLVLNPAIIMLCCHLVIFSISYFLPKSSLDSGKAVNNCQSLAFQTIQNGEIVKTLGDAPLTIETNILGNSGIAFFTPYHYVAGFYHREGKGMKVRDFIFESEHMNDIRATLKERGIRALYICPSPVKDAWVNKSFDGKETLYPSWVTVRDDLDFPRDHVLTTKPILLMVNP